MKKLWSSLILICILLLFHGCSKYSSDEFPTNQSTETSITTNATSPIEGYRVCSYTSVTSIIPQFSNADSSDILTFQDELDRVTVNCYRLPRYASKWYSRNTYLTCIDEYEMNQGSHYTVCSLVSGSVTEIEKFSFLKDYELFDTAVHIELEYSIKDNEIIITHVPSNSGDPSMPRYLNTGLGADCIMVSFYVQLPDGSNVHYPLLVDLNNETVIDFLSGYSLEAFTDFLSNGISAVAFLDEQSFVAKSYAGKCCYFDTSNNAAYFLDDLTKSLISDCCVVDDLIICWNTAGTYFKIDPSNMTVTRIVQSADVRFTSGIRYGSGCSFMFYNTKLGDLHVYDFITGEDVKCELPQGWTIDVNRCSVSFDGRKLVTYQNCDGTYQLLQFDCDTKQFTHIERTNANGIPDGMIYMTVSGEIVVESQSRQEVYIYTVS